MICTATLPILHQDSCMTTTTSHRVYKQQRKRRMRLLGGVGGILLLIVLSEVFRNNILRSAWQVWHGKVVTWRGITLEIDDGYFLFSHDGDNQLMIGRFGESEEPFPDDNLLMLLHREREAQDILIIFSEVCKKISCKDYQERTELVNNIVIRCTEFQAHLKPWPEPGFHVHCQARGSDVLLEYHGNRREYENFSSMITAILHAVTQKIYNESLFQPIQD